MRGQRVLRHTHRASQLAGRDAGWLMLDQQPGGIEAGGLRERGEGGDGFIRIHISRLIEILR